MNSEFALRLEKIENILRSFLPEQTNKDWQRLSFGTLDPCVTDTHITHLISPCRNLLDLGGKRWRPLLLVLCAELASEAKKYSTTEAASAVEKAIKLTPLVEFAHTASLIHDDIEDEADTRRGKPATHITYGLDTALNAGSWLYFEATTCIDALDISENEKNIFYALFLRELRRLHLGQAMDIFWHRNPKLIPSVDEYTAMVRNKTGTLSRLAVKTGILAGGGTPEEAEKAGFLAEDIGTGFQILDDVTNLTTGNPGKKRGDDIVEGKKSLPVLYHLAENPNDKNELSNLFEQARNEGIDSPAVEKAISILTDSGAVQKAAQKGNEIICSKSLELGSIYGNSLSNAKTLIIELFDSMKKA